MLTLLTMTGARPEAWELCKRWMRNQTYAKPARWVIVDDGPDAQSLHGVPEEWQIDLVRRRPYWEPGQNTQALNILAGLDQIKPKEKLVIIEDDDYYRSEYLETIDKWLDMWELVGESHTTYLNVQNGGSYRCNNDKHASLCATGLTAQAIPLLSTIAGKEHKFIDLHLWQQWRGASKLSDTDMVIGIKGLPGRPGIGAGHRMQGEADYAKIEAIIGPDAIHYREYMNK